MTKLLIKFTFFKKKETILIQQNMISEIPLK